jgi:hypothetical protein
MIGLHIAVKLPGIVGNPDVNWGQAVIVVSRFAALIHPSVSGNRY